MITGLLTTMGEKHNEMETPAASTMADIRPTMAPAIPCGAGQSPQQGQRRRRSSAEESARQTDTRVKGCPKGLPLLRQT